MRSFRTERTAQPCETMELHTQRMRTFTIPETVEAEKRASGEVREFVTRWVGLLADQKYAEAVDALSPEIPPGSGSVDSRDATQWTPQLLAAVIANYGTPEPVKGQPQSYVVVPLDASLRDAFETNVFIDFDREAISNRAADPTSPQARTPRMRWLSTVLQFLRAGKTANKYRNRWLGAVEFQLPLNFARGNDVSDLSARMVFKAVTASDMVLVLLDIHVL